VETGLKLNFLFLQPTDLTEWFQIAPCPAAFFKSHPFLTLVLKSFPLAIPLPATLIFSEADQKEKPREKVTTLP
jgi:hypothetical protein